jgi:hypothetical protein
MKIQFFGSDCFAVDGKNTSFVFNPTEKFKEKVDFVLNSGEETTQTQNLEAKKKLSLPGESEISGALVRGFFSRPENVVYKVALNGISFVHFGSLESKPSADFFEKLGENTDVLFVCLNEKFDVKQVKELAETLDPRYLIVGGDQKQFPAMIEEGARMHEESSIPLSQGILNEEKCEILILGE